MVCRIEAAPLEIDGHGMKDAACLTLAARTDAHWILIEALPSVEVEVTKATFILINGHTVPR
jgi:hypothetical protein